jgi:hypothetical protein
MSSVICIAEDRLSEMIAVKLLVLSLVKHCPDAKIILTFPPATADFQKWITKFEQVDLRTKPFSGAYGWNVKPHSLLSLFEEGFSELFWIDSDIILTRDFRCNLGRLSPSTIILCEDLFCEESSSRLLDFPPFHPWDHGRRAKNWGFEIGRTFPLVLNTCFIRVTKEHIPLLNRWKELLESDIYRQNQKKPFDQKEGHLYSDQDVLTALLTSREFSDIPIKLFHRGQDIIQYYGPLGYPIRERLSHLFKGLPPFIHSPGTKPWRSLKDLIWATRLQLWYHSLLLELSPYNYIARQYKNEVDEPTPWLDRYSKFGIFLRILGIGNPSLTGLPIPILFPLWNFMKRIIK